MIAVIPAGTTLFGIGMRGAPGNRPWWVLAIWMAAAAFLFGAGLYHEFRVLLENDDRPG